MALANQVLRHMYIVRKTRCCCLVLLNIDLSRKPFSVILMFSVFCVNFFKHLKNARTGALLDVRISSVLCSQVPQLTWSGNLTRFCGLLGH